MWMPIIRLVGKPRNRHSERRELEPSGAVNSPLEALMTSHVTWYLPNGLHGNGLQRDLGKGIFTTSRLLCALGKRFTTPCNINDVQRWSW